MRARQLEWCKLGFLIGTVALWNVELLRAHCHRVPLVHRRLLFQSDTLRQKACGLTSQVRNFLKHNFGIIQYLQDMSNTEYVSTKPAGPLSYQLLLKSTRYRQNLRAQSQHRDAATSHARRVRNSKAFSKNWRIASKVPRIKWSEIGSPDHPSL